MAVSCLNLERIIQRSRKYVFIENVLAGASRLMNQAPDAVSRWDASAFGINTCIHRNCIVRRRCLRAARERCRIAALDVALIVARSPSTRWTAASRQWSPDRRRVVEKDRGSPWCCRGWPEYTGRARPAIGLEVEGLTDHAGRILPGINDGTCRGVKKSRDSCSASRTGIVGIHGVTIRQEKRFHAPGNSRNSRI